MGDEIECRIAEFGEIMRRNRSRHADGDALRAIGEQVRQSRGKNDRLLLVAGIIVAEIDGVFVDAFEQKARDIGHARFGVAIGGGTVAVDIAEVPLTLDERVARGKILREPHQGVIDRLVAVRMERPHHVADDFRAFLERGARVEPQDLHAVENAPMHRLQPVARIRQRPPHDGRKGIGEIALFERVLQVHAIGTVGRRRIDWLAHAERLNEGASRRKFAVRPSQRNSGDSAKIRRSDRGVAARALERLTDFLYPSRHRLCAAAQQPKQGHAS